MYAINLPQSSLRRGGFTTNEVVFIFYSPSKDFSAKKPKTCWTRGVHGRGRGPMSELTAVNHMSQSPAPLIRKVNNKKSR